MNEKPLPTLFVVIVIFTSLALFCTAFGFAVPLWIQRKPDSHNQFVCIGLWVACFEGYMHRETYTKSYYGCWYIFHKYFDNVRDWVTPEWFTACQILFTAAFIMQVISTVVIICQACRMLAIYHIRVLRGHILVQFLSACFILITLICFGQKSGDTRWMPKPEMNNLSWSFALSVIGLACTVITFILLFYMYGQRHKEVQEQQKALDQQNLLPQEAAYDPRAPPMYFSVAGNAEAGSTA